MLCCGTRNRAEMENKLRANPEVFLRSLNPRDRDGGQPVAWRKMRSTSSGDDGDWDELVVAAQL